MRLRLKLGVRLVVVKMVRPLRRLMGGARVGVGVGIRRMFPTLVRKLRHGPLCEGPQGPPRDLDEGGRGARRLVGQIASGSASLRRDESGVDSDWVCELWAADWAWCLVAWSPCRLVVLGSEGSRLTV